MLIAMKALTIIGGFRYFLCHSWPVALIVGQIVSYPVIQSLSVFALVRHSLLRRRYCSILENEWENGERAGCDSHACQESTR